MGNIGDTITETAPAVGTSGPGYATTINAILTELRARLIKKIPMSALLTNSDLDLNGHALLNAAYITLLDESVSPSGVLSPSNRIAAFDGNLWWISPEGALRISDGPNLNASGVGGITGDYSGAGPMEFRYDLANTRYDAFANQSTNTWAYVRARGFDIAGGATSTFKVRLETEPTLASNYTLILPDEGLPANDSLVLISPSGDLTFSDTLFSNQNIILSGTGYVKLSGANSDLKHGDRTVAMDLIAGAVVSSGTLSTSVSSNAIFATLSANGNMSIKLPLKKGDRLSNLRLVGSSTQDITLALFTQAGNVASSVTISDDGFTIPTNGWKSFTVTVPTALTDNGGGDDEVHILNIAAGTASVQFSLATLIYDRP